MGPHAHDAQLRRDLTAALLANGNRLLNLRSPEDALRAATQTLLANNPFVPPAAGSCPIHGLPDELLAHIFVLGTQIETEEGVDGEEEEEEEEDGYVDEVDLKEEWEGNGGSDADVDTETRNAERKSRKASKVRNEHLAKEDWEDEEMGENDEDSEQEQDDDDDEDEDEDDTYLPFQVLVSHVCRRWRAIALDTPALWTSITFSEGVPFTKSQEWIARAKGQPLDISIDCNFPDDWDPDIHVGTPPSSPVPSDPAAAVQELHCTEAHAPPFLTLADLRAALALVTPHAAQWRAFEVMATQYSYIHYVLSVLAALPGAPALEVLELYHYEDCDDNERFCPAALGTRFLPFHGHTPRLTNVALWGVHLDWPRAAAAGMFAAVRDLELAYHAKDVRPSFRTFAKIAGASSVLRTLTLCLSGPAGRMNERGRWAWDMGEGSDDDGKEHDGGGDEGGDGDGQEGGEGSKVLELSSLEELVLCYHEPAYVEALLPCLALPNVHSLTLDFDDGDYTAFVRQLANAEAHRGAGAAANTHAAAGKRKSLLAQLKHLKIAGLPCSRSAVDAMLGELGGLRSVNLNCTKEDEYLFDQLMQPSPSQSSAAAGCYRDGKMLTNWRCPHLETVTTTGISGERMRAFVEARRAAGVPVKRVSMNEEDDVGPREEEWLRAHLEALEFFEASDDEEEVEEVEEDEDEEGGDMGVDDGDDEWEDV